MYEVAWARNAAVIFGSTAHSTSTMLAVFMGGLAAGSFFFGWLADAPKRRPLLYYAALEAGIGIYALLTPVLFQFVQTTQNALYGSLPPGHPAFGVTRVLLLGAVVAPPSVMMGGTFPLVTKFLVTHRLGVGRWVGRLYFVNTAGAVVGTVLTTFVLIASMGVTWTIYLAAMVNLAIGVSVFLLQRTVSAIPWNEMPPASAQAQKTVRRRGQRSLSGGHSEPLPHCDASTPAMYRMLVLAVAVSGAGSLSLEVSWTRALVLVLGSSVYAFGLVLAVFLTGIALGSLLAGAPADRQRNPWTTFALLHVAIGASIMVFGSSLDRLPLLFLRLSSSVPGSFWALQTLSVLLLFLVMLVPTTLMGAAFPLAIRLRNSDLDAVGRSVGYLYFTNTTGAVLGALATGFWLIPITGMEWSIRLVVLLYVAVGAALTLANPRWVGWSRGLVMGAAAAIVAVAAMAPGWDRGVLSAGAFMTAGRLQEPGARARPSAVLSTGRLAYYREGLTATVAVEKTLDNLVLIINGKPDASLNPVDMETQVLLGHLPMFLHPKPQQVLVVGLGSGITVGSVLRHPVRQVDVAEIESAVVEAAQLFAPHTYDALRDPRTRIAVVDAQTYVAALPPHRYDVIIAEPSNPWIRGMSNLFTREQFELYRSRLRDDGVVVQWLHLENMSLDDFRIVASTFCSVFPRASLWSNPSGADVFFVGTQGPLALDYGRVEDMMSRPEVSEDLARGNVEGPLTLLGLFLMDAESLRRFAGRAPVHTSDRPLLDYSTPKNLYSATLSQNLAALDDHQDDVLPLLSNLRLPGRNEEESLREVQARLPQVVKSRQLTAMGFGEESRGDDSEATSHYLRAVEVDPHNLSARTLLALMYLGFGNAALREDRVSALGLFEQAVQARPTFAPARRALASSYARLDRLDDAVTQLRALLEHYPKDAIGRGDLGLYLYRLSRPVEAEAELLRALDLDPSLYIVRNVLASLYVGERRWAEAEQQILLSLQAQQDQPKVRDMLKFSASRGQSPPVRATTSP